MMQLIGDFQRVDVQKALSAVSEQQVWVFPHAAFVKAWEFLTQVLLTIAVRLAD